MNKVDVKPTKRYDNLKKLLVDATKNYGERDLFRYKKKKEIISKTYNQFFADSMVFSNVLKSLGILEKHIAVVGATSYEWLVTYFGTVNSNSVIVPIDKELSASDIAELLNRADIVAFVFDDLLADRIDEIRKECKNIKYFISISSEEDKDGILSFSKLLQNNQGDFDVEIDNNKMCTILFTSGTTGKSKGVMLSHTSLADNATCMDMDISVGSVTLSVLPIHHAYCFTCDILVCLCCGSTCCFNDSVMRLAKNLNVFHPDIILLVPLIIESLYYKISEVAKANPQIPKEMIAKQAFGGSLHTIFSGGAYLNPALIEAFKEFGISLIQGYGMTEFSPRISSNTKDFTKFNSVGVLIPGCEAKVEDGEILVRGKSMMLGYYKDEKSTNEALSNGWLRTGDLGYIDEDNFVFITGRKKNLIILANGENISPEELENKFNGWLIAKELIVSSDKGQVIAEMFPNEDYVKAAGITDVEQAFNNKVDEINENLPMYKRINQAIVRTEEFEKTSSGKIKRKY